MWGWQRLTVQESGVAADHQKHAREEGGLCEGCVEKRVPAREVAVGGPGRAVWAKPRAPGSASNIRHQFPPSLPPFFLPVPSEQWPISK